MQLHAIRLARRNAQARLIERIEAHLALLGTAHQCGPREQRLFVVVVRPDGGRCVPVVLFERVVRDVQSHFDGAKGVRQVTPVAAVAEDFQVIGAVSMARLDCVLLIVDQIQVVYDWMNRKECCALRI